ncbi:MAG TPA: putative toxin-antitoxin system toxin component, PIN family [Pyrinomonadaceae bacterium]|nr:putative toxin-antitoxin system toxin component, PIN family [Pyrinomonadaceae bacterium]
MRVVADTSIVVSGLLWRGNPRRVLDAARDGIIELFTSQSLLEELEDVLGRKKFATRLGAAHVTVNELLLGYAALATVIEVSAIEPVILADPDDDAVLACALAAQSEVITSGDSHLLDLKEHQHIRILTATELLAELSL